MQLTELKPMWDKCSLKELDNTLRHVDSNSRPEVAKELSAYIEQRNQLLIQNDRNAKELEETDEQSSIWIEPQKMKPTRLNTGVRFLIGAFVLIACLVVPVFLEFTFQEWSLMQFSGFVTVVFAGTALVTVSILERWELENVWESHRLGKLSSTNKIVFLVAGIVVSIIHFVAYWGFFIAASFFFVSLIWNLVGNVT